MTYFSVIVPTLRVGGLDILMAGLEQQTFRNFELVLVDSLYKYRKGIVAEKAKKYNFPIKHVEPINNPFPLNSYQRCVNTGLVHAKGQLAYFTCDYAWLPPECLSMHAHFHMSTGVLHSMFGIIHLHRLPTLKPGFKANYGLNELGHGKISHSEVMSKWDNQEIRHKATTEWCKAYCKDLQSGELDPYMWSIFEKEYESEDDPRELEVLHVEMKSTKPEGFIEGQYCHLKNDTIPIEPLLNLNGFDEEFDGSHGWQDSEVATRLTARVGMKWYLKPNCIVHITDVHGVMTIRKMLRPEQSNESIYLTKYAKGYPDPINNWNLREARASFLV